MVKAVVCKTTVKTSQVRILALPNETNENTPDLVNSKWNADRFTGTSKPELFVRIWVAIRIMFNSTNSNRNIFSNALRSTCGFGI